MYEDCGIAALGIEPVRFMQRAMRFESIRNGRDLNAPPIIRDANNTKERQMRVAMVLIVLALGLWSGASTAQTSSVPISVFCVNPTGELCSPPANLPVTTAGVLQVSYAAPASHCGDVLIHFLVDGVEVAATGFLAPGQASGTFDLGPVSAGNHILGIQGEGRVGGCNAGIEFGFGGTVTITVSSLAAAAQPIPGPGMAITAIALLIAAFAVFRYRRA